MGIVGWIIWWNKFCVGGPGHLDIVRVTSLTGTRKCNEGHQGVAAELWDGPNEYN